MAWLDYWVVYNTPKYVNVKDQRLAILAYSTYFVVFVYIFVYSMMYSNDHLSKVLLYGSSAARILGPGQAADCDADAGGRAGGCEGRWPALSELPYCSQYSGEGEKAAVQYDCVYRDNYDMAAPFITPGYYFMQTVSNRSKQMRGCVPSEGNGWTCDSNLFNWDAGFESQVSYVPALEEFSFHLKPMLNKEHPNVPSHPEAFVALSAAQSEREKEAWIKAHPKARQAAIDKAHRVDLKGNPLTALPKGSNASSLQGLPSLRITSDGYISVSVGDMLAMALGEESSHFLDEPSAETGMPMRETGGVLSLNVRYTNRGLADLWGSNRAILVLSAELLPSLDVRLWKSKDISADERYIDDNKGLIIVLHVEGNIQFLVLSECLVLLAQSVVLFAAAMVVTDYIMIYIPCADLKGKGQTLKYQPWEPPPNPLSEDLQQVVEETHFERPLLYQMLLVKLMEEDRKPTRDELLALLMKLEVRLQNIDAFHDQEGQTVDDIDAYLAKFETAFIRDYCLTKAVKRVSQGQVRGSLVATPEEPPPGSKRPSVAPGSS
eukprot:TRINITY_DN74357_c0_g1_i1.p1 TRINITY_DN74357_c0_g1~~TRINITY_DN74357_c0_g1_i1.p1  ORF type:complete len:548 (+),score=120.78 TRINITY_DN74357_c0_g1_i1:139-1782(+)